MGLLPFRWSLLGLLLAVVPARVAGQTIFHAPPASRKEKPDTRAAAMAPRPPGVAAGLPAAPVHELRGPVRAAMPQARASDAPLIGTVRAVEADAPGTGRCDVLPGGGEVWRWAVRSPAAAALRIHFRAFDAGAGSVWVHAGGVALGPYTRKGPFGGGDFWTGLVFSDEATVEYAGPGPCPAAPPFRVAEIAHIWTDLLSGPQQAAEPAASCQPDATCYPEFARQAASVARFTYVRDGGSYVCSGALVNTTPYSGIPYFLTAHHCIGDDEEARTMAVFWFYQTDSCNGVAPSMYSLPYQSAGAAYVAGASFDGGDFTLVRLNSVDGIPNLSYSGWTTAEPEIGDNLVGIHHPGNQNDYKRIALGTRAKNRTVTVDGSQTAPSNSFYRAQWSVGRIQHGSSGSPLFVHSAADNAWVIGGVLSYGPTMTADTDVCAIDPFYAGYGRFSVIWPYVQEYLARPVCTYSLSAADSGFAPEVGTGTVRVHADGGCGWSAAANQPWIVVTAGGSGAGDGAIGYSVAANSGAARQGAIAVGGQVFRIDQAGATASPAAPVGRITPRVPRDPDGGAEHNVR